MPLHDLTPKSNYQAEGGATEWQIHNSGDEVRISKPIMKEKDQQDEKATRTKETDSNKAQERHSSSVVEDFDVTSGTSKTAFSLNSVYK